MIKSKGITEEELKEIQLLQNQQTVLISSLGSIEYQLINLPQQKDQVLKAIADTEKKYEEKQKEIKKKYGDVVIDLETGQFVEE